MGPRRRRDVPPARINCVDGVDQVLAAGRRGRSSLAPHRTMTSYPTIAGPARRWKGQKKEQTLELARAMETDWDAVDVEAGQRQAAVVISASVFRVECCRRRDYDTGYYSIDTLIHTFTHLCCRRALWCRWVPGVRSAGQAVVGVSSIYGGGLLRPTAQPSPAV